MRSPWIGALCLLGILCAPAQARHRGYVVLDPSCNVTMPCEGGYYSANAKRFIGIPFGTPLQHYTPQRRIKQAVPVPRRHTTRIAHRAHKSRIPVTAEAIGRGVVKASTGAVAYVNAKAVKAFQCVVSSLEDAGYKIHEMGGYASGGHIKGSLHYSGMALDINQQSRNVTIPKMPVNEVALARSCGLISGAQWRDADSGHFQMGGWAGYSQTKRHYASRHTRHVRYASR